MSDLREQLARRLFYVAPPMPLSEFSPSPRFENLTEAQSPGISNMYMALADECIRQMKWARNTGEQEVYSATTLPFVRDRLRFATEDWKP